MFWPRKVDVRLPEKEHSNSYGAKPVHPIIRMIKWIRTSRWPIKNSLFVLVAVTALRSNAFYATRSPPALHHPRYISHWMGAWRAKISRPVSLSRLFLFLSLSLSLSLPLHVSNMPDRFVAAHCAERSRQREHYADLRTTASQKWEEVPRRARI